MLRVAEDAGFEPARVVTPNTISNSLAGYSGVQTFAAVQGHEAAEPTEASLNGLN